MSERSPDEDQVLELLWMEAVSLIEECHPALVDRISDKPGAELARTLLLKQAGQDLQTYAAAAEAIMRRRGQAE